MNLFVNRESSVPIHDQLVAQIDHLVAAGILVPGQRLPSIRGLAARLGVHHLTILGAYRALAERGVLAIREGSGVRVAEDLAPPAGGWREGTALRALAAYFVEQARARGQDDAAIRVAFEQALGTTGVRRLVVVNPHRDLQACYAHELGERVNLPVEGLTPQEAEARGAAAFEDALVLTSTNFVAALKWADPGVFKLGSTEALLARIKALPATPTVAVVSNSERIVFLTGQLLGALLPDDRLLSAELQDVERARGALKLADVVITDPQSEVEVRRGTRAEVLVRRLLADAFFGELAERLPPAAFHLRAPRAPSDL